MKIAVVGSRRRKDKETIVEFVNSLPEYTEVVSGGCRGVDTWAEEAALMRNLKVTIFKPAIMPNMPYYEMVKAYYARNRQIAEYADAVVAFVADDRKGGTENTIKYANELRKPVVIFTKRSATNDARQPDRKFF